MLKAELINPFLEGAITFFKQEWELILPEANPGLENLTQLQRKLPLWSESAGNQKGLCCIQ